ncbi:MAG: ERF family protein [Reinekea sp.]|nr:ERF family protein [Reinekea sp.]
MSELNIYQRINAVMQEVDYVKKDRAVSGGGANYKAVTHDQAVSVIRASLVKHGIVIEPKQREGEFIQMRDLNLPVPVKMGLYSGFYDVHFVNIDKPEDRTIVSVEAHANDNGDKAPGKAMTYAVKTAILKQFTLETGEDDESRSEANDINFINDEQQRVLFELLCDHQGMYTPKGQRIARAYKFNNLTEIKSKKYEEILKAAKQ